MDQNMIMNGQTPTQGPINPIVFTPLPEALKGVQNKRPEEKLYIIMYYYGDDEKGFELCIGRMECYETIGRLAATYSDLQYFNSVVLVEVLAVSRENKAEWMLKHPHNAPTLYEFCKNVEMYFPNSDFHIDDYVSADQEDISDTEDKGSTEVEFQAGYNAPPVTDEMVNAYKDILKQKEKEEQ